MANADRNLLPKSGKVNEMCREWLVREDGALAYRLQNQEITDHYQGNKQRNALVREDFPRALDEQLREQKLAEQAAFVYQQMLEEQEKVDSEYAKQLAKKLEWEEKAKRQALQMQDQFIAKQIHEEGNFNLLLPSNGVQYLNDGEVPIPMGVSPVSPISLSPSRNQQPINNNYHCYTPRRQAKPMPLPPLNTSYVYKQPQPPPIPPKTPTTTDSYAYNEVYDPASDLNLLEINDEDSIRRKLQEEKDAELARQLQEKENSSETSQLDRDRMLAIEAQDKELAKLLQEKERQKIRRARERAKQKSLIKKQQQQQQQMQIPGAEESYSDPVDLIITGSGASSQAIEDDVVCYSLPADAVVKRPTNLQSKGDTSPSSSSSSPNNIAIAIDPTYNKRRSQNYGRKEAIVPIISPCSSTSSSGCSPVVCEETETSPVPPYMPIQGQRRTFSLEKKTNKKKVKDGCKQQ